MRQRKILFLLPFFLVLFSLVGALYLFILGDHQAFATCSSASVDNANYQFNGLVSAPTKSGNIIGTSGTTCVIDSGAPIDPTDLTKGYYSYDALKTQFFDKASSAVTKNTVTATVPSFSLTALTASSPIFSASARQLWLVNGNITTVGSGDFDNTNGSVPALLFVNGNLDIDHNITYSNGIVFVVNGDITIEPSVTTLNAVLIAQGDICDYSGDPKACANTTTDDNSLNVQGSLIDLQDDTNTHIHLVRDQSTGPSANTTPVEQINFDPQYLAILRQLMGQNLTVTTEGTSFAATPAP